MSYADNTSDSEPHLVGFFSSDSTPRSVRSLEFDYLEEDSSMSTGITHRDGRKVQSPVGFAMFGSHAHHQQTRQPRLLELLAKPKSRRCSIHAIQMLRSRSKNCPGELPLSRSSDSTMSDAKPKLAHPSRNLLHYRSILQWIILVFIGIVSLSIYITVYKSQTSSLHLGASRVAARHRHPTSHKHTTKDISGPPLQRRLPVVERSILDKLARLEEFPDPDERVEDLVKPRWPPSVTQIPEPQVALETYPGFDPTKFERELCGDDTTFNSCRFLLPLRIAEQESKARIHLLQIIRLARELDRTVVLPNVAKSRIGTCFKWDFEEYYDPARLSAEFKGVRFVKMKIFKLWMETRSSWPTGQIVFISSKPDRYAVLHNRTQFSEANVSLRVDDARDPQDLNLPGCFMTKFHRLQLKSFSPLFVNPAVAGTEKNNPIGKSVAAILIRDDIQEASFRPDPWLRSTRQEQIQDLHLLPDVLVINWDLRHPAFALTETPAALHYSSALSSMATKLGPKTPYLVIHWRMETVPPEDLPDCAESLVESLSELLNDRSIAHDVRTVWFASDYPYPISRGSAERVAKSGTFKDLKEEHHEAVDILRSAFERGGILAEWHITGFAEGLEQVLAMKDHGVNEELLQDTGVIGIMDKLIATQAALFISGGKRCGRARSVIIHAL